MRNLNSFRVIGTHIENQYNIERENEKLKAQRMYIVLFDIFVAVVLLDYSFNFLQLNGSHHDYIL